MRYYIDETVVAKASQIFWYGRFVFIASYRSRVLSRKLGFLFLIFWDRDAGWISTCHQLHALSSIVLSITRGHFSVASIFCLGALVPLQYVLLSLDSWYDSLMLVSHMGGSSIPALKVSLGDH